MDKGLSAVLVHEHHVIDAGIEAFLAGLSLGETRMQELPRAVEPLRRHLSLAEEFLFPPLRHAATTPTSPVVPRQHGAACRSAPATPSLPPPPAPPTPPIAAGSLGRRRWACRIERGCARIRSSVEARVRGHPPSGCRGRRHRWLQAPCRRRPAPSCPPCRPARRRRPVRWRYSCPRSTSHGGYP